MKLFCYLIVVLVGCSAHKTSTIELINEMDAKNLTPEYYAKIWESMDKKRAFEEFDYQKLEKINVQALLDYEKQLLSNWIELPEYADTVLVGIKNPTEDEFLKCATRDRATKHAFRTLAPQAEQQMMYFRYMNASIRIPVRVHIVNKDSRYMVYDPSQVNPKRHVTLASIKKQFDILDQAFNESNISFEIASIDSVNNSRWNESGAYGYSPQLLYEMLNALAVTPETHLNLYIIDGRERGDFLLGEATFPWASSANRIDDYVVISCRSMPGIFDPSNFVNGGGKTLVHEIGHYLGLWHTFEGGAKCYDHLDNRGCYYGDRVADTPAQNYCHFGPCDCAGQVCDTCSEDVLDDPVNNYMGYNDDACLTEFTPGQISRIYKCTDFFRPHFFNGIF